MHQVKRTQFSFFEILVKNIGMFSTIFFVFKKASKPLNKSERRKWMNRVYMIFLLGLPVNIAMLIYIELDLSAIYGQAPPDQEDLDPQTSLIRQYKYDCVTCTSPFWITNSIAEFTQLICFYLLVKKIQLALDRKIEEEMRDYGYPRDYFKSQLLQM